LFGLGFPDTRVGLEDGTFSAEGFEMIFEGKFVGFSGFTQTWALLHTRRWSIGCFLFKGLVDPELLPAFFW